MVLGLAVLVLVLVEIALFAAAGDLIGAGATVLLVILAGIAGIAIIRRQGLVAVARLEAAMARGGDPAGPLAHGALVLLAGLLLVLPGFLSDAAGLLLLVPPVRRFLLRRAGRRIAARMVVAGRWARPSPGEVIEGTYTAGDDPGDPGRR